MVWGPLQVHCSSGSQRHDESDYPHSLYSSSLCFHPRYIVSRILFQSCLSFHPRGLMPVLPNLMLSSSCWPKCKHDQNNTVFNMQYVERASTTRSGDTHASGKMLSSAHDLFFLCLPIQHILCATHPISSPTKMRCVRAHMRVRA